jgi:hypothetical protein
MTAKNQSDLNVNCKFDDLDGASHLVSQDVEFRREAATVSDCYHVVRLVPCKTSKLVQHFVTTFTHITIVVIVPHSAEGILTSDQSHLRSSGGRYKGNSLLSTDAVKLGIQHTV